MILPPVLPPKRLSFSLWSRCSRTSPAPSGTSRLPRLRALFAVASLTLMTASCVGSNSTRRELPPPPAFAKPSEVPERKIGEPLILVTGRERAGRLAANRTIDAFRGWYEDVRRDYAGKE